jgi:hypothetical protein
MAAAIIIIIIIQLFIYFNVLTQQLQEPITEPACVKHRDNMQVTIKNLKIIKYKNNKFTIRLLMQLLLLHLRKLLLVILLLKQ